MRLYYIAPAGLDEEEIIGPTFEKVVSSLDGGGVLSIRFSDYEFSNWSTLKKYGWAPVEVREDDGTTVIWEGWIVQMPRDALNVWYAGWDGLRVLDGIRANHSSIIANGTVTAVDADDTPPTITDENAAFTSAVNGKPVIFTDTNTPGVEIVNASAGSFSGAANDTETGTYADTAGGSVMGCVKLVGSDNYNGVNLEFTCPNFATSTKVVIEAKCKVSWFSYYENGSEPQILVYDDDASGYRSTDIADEIVGIGDIDCAGGDSNCGWCKELTSFHTFMVTIGPDNIDHYFDASGVLKISIQCGDVGDYPHAVHVLFAQVTNTYEALFDEAAETVYTVDAYDATSLTFTGQTPVADGIAVGDMYKVGYLLSDIVTHMWTRGRVTGMAIDFDATIEADAQDYMYGYIGGYLREFTSRLNRKIWHAIGWTIKCKSSYTATTGDAATITDADMIADKKGKGWRLDTDLTHIKSGVTIFGDSVEYERYPERSGYNEYPSPLWLLQTEPNIHSLTSAFNLANSLFAKHKNAKRRLTFTLDREADGKNYSSLDVGKTIGSITIQTDKITMTNALIVQLDHFQTGAGHLNVTVTVEEQL